MEMLLVSDMTELKNNQMGRFIKYFFIVIFLHFPIIVNAQIRKGYSDVPINEEYLTLISYFSKSPTSRVLFAENYYMLEDMGTYTPVIIKYDLDGLSGYDSPSFLGVGFTGPNIIQKDSMFVSIERWGLNLTKGTFDNPEITPFPIFSDSDFNLYQFLIEYCKNGPCGRIKYLEDLLKFDALNIPLIFLIKVDLDNLCGMYTSWTTEEDLQYINMYNIRNSISVWKSQMTCE